MGPDAKLLLELRDRGFFTADDALEICGRCRRRAERAVRELGQARLIKKNSQPWRKARWTFQEPAQK